MVTNQRALVIRLLVIIAAILGILILYGILHAGLLSLHSYRTPNGNVNIWIPIPDTPQNLTKYRVVPKMNDTAYFSVNNLEQKRLNVTSVDDVPLVVPKVLENYGGLPEDAVMTYAETGYLEQIGDSGIPFIPSKVIAKSPISTDVQYGRKINGIPATGEGSFIKLILGNDGELLYLNKVWRTVEPAGTEKVIPVSKAIEKLGRGEVLDPLKCICDINVDRIYIAYWEKGASVQQDYLDPVWVFSGKTSSGEVINYKVYARDDDSSLMTPVSGLESVPADVNPMSQQINRLSVVSESVNTTEKAGNIS